MKPIISYIFVIDTEQYAGNFERQLCAWLTGQYGDCEVGKELAEQVPVEVKDLFEDKLTHKPDEHGICRPCEIYPTPGWINDAGNHQKGQGGYPAYLSVAIFLDSVPNLEMINALRNRCESFNTARNLYHYTKEYSLEPIKFTGFRLIKQTTTFKETRL